MNDATFNAFKRRPRFCSLSQLKTKTRKTYIKLAHIRTASFQVNKHPKIHILTRFKHTFLNVLPKVNSSNLRLIYILFKYLNVLLIICNYCQWSLLTFFLV